MGDIDDIIEGLCKWIEALLTQVESLQARIEEMIEETLE